MQRIPFYRYPKVFDGVQLEDLGRGIWKIPHIDYSTSQLLGWDLCTVLALRVFWVSVAALAWLILCYDRASQGSHGLLEEAGKLWARFDSLASVLSLTPH